MHEHLSVLSHVDIDLKWKVRRGDGERDGRRKSEERKRGERREERWRREREKTEEEERKRK